MKCNVCGDTRRVQLYTHDTPVAAFIDCPKCKFPIVKVIDATCSTTDPVMDSSDPLYKQLRTILAQHIAEKLIPELTIKETAVGDPSAPEYVYGVRIEVTDTYNKYGE